MRLSQSIFFDCHHKYHATEEQTYFGKSSKYPFQDDHLFVSQDLAERVKSCYVLDNETIRNFSDHLHVIAEICLSPICLNGKLDKEENSVSHNMTQDNDAAIKERLEQAQNALMEKIKKVRQQTLRKFLTYYCINGAEDEGINVQSRRAKYDYKLAREIINQFLDDVDDFTDPQLFARIELDRLNKEKHEQEEEQS